MIAELQIPTDDGENSKFLSMKVWEIDYISSVSTTGHTGASINHPVHVRTNDGEDYYPVQVNFREEST
jgi:hypothetical protein